MIEETAVFFGLWLQKPLQIATVCPSGERLAEAIARLIDFDRPGRVLELGAGTGGLTRGLLQAGCPIERLTALEAELQLIAVLRRRFPSLQVIAGDAVELDRRLDEHRIDRLSVVVSSLPIKWFPVAAQRAVVEPCFERLGPGGRFLQLTNAFTSPLARDALGIRGREAVRVWRNVPPAQVWIYSQSAAGPGQEAP